jgi:replicative DNA helicase
LDWLEARITEAIAKYDTKIVMIDHLHYLIDMAKVHNPSLEIGGIVRRLKKIAVQWGIIIFLICHTAKTQLDQELEIADIRDSSLIAQEADIVLMIKRKYGEDKNGNRAILGIRKNRKTGQLGNLNLVCVQKRFELLDTHEEEKNEPEDY